jgi:hypothetical protein
MSTPIRATPTAYTVALDLTGAPTVPMRYSRVPGRMFQPFHVVLAYRRPLSGNDWQVSASLYGWLCRKDGSAGEQRTDDSLSRAEFPEWLSALAGKHHPAGAR